MDKRLDLAMNSERPLPTAEDVNALHALYCKLTGQELRLNYERERLWWELMKEGYGQTDLRIVISYLQREIRNARRNVGALKLSNLLQPDRFSEDLAISRVHLQAPGKPPVSKSPNHKPPEAEVERLRQNALVQLDALKKQLGFRK